MVFACRVNRYNLNRVTDCTGENNTCICATVRENNDQAEERQQAQLKRGLATLRVYHCSKFQTVTSVLCSTDSTSVNH